MLNKENIIDETVRSFYQKAIDDILIGYHFNHIKDFESHLLKIIAFWKWQLLKVDYPKDLPPIELMQTHLYLKIKKGEVGRWVKIFIETIKDKKLEADFESLWIKKIKDFEKIFLNSKQLFSDLS